MPEVGLGEIVLWYPGGDKNAGPHPGIVTRIAFRTICLNLISPAFMNFAIKDGVRHMDDPEIKEAERHEMGGWDFTPLAKELRRLIEASPRPKPVK
jgi:hypothetical protein